MMKMIRGIEITSTVLTDTSVPEDVVAVYDAGTTYAIGDRAGTAVTNGAAQTVYQSKTAGNVGNALSNTTHWRLLSTVYPAYSGAVTYALNDIVSNLTTHRLFKSLAGGNSGNPLTDETKWENIGATNAYAMFDPVVQDQTTVGDGFEVEISSDTTFITGIGFLNVIASSIEVEVLSGIDVVFSETYNMNEAPSQAGMWFWLFEPVSRKTSLYVDGIPPILGSDITATFTGSGNVSCGIMSVGESTIIGTSVFGANWSIISYSQKVESESGRITIDRGSYRDVVDAPVVIGDPSFGAVTRMLNDNRDTPAVWSVDDSYPLIYGFYDRYDLMLSNPAFSELTIRIEGLV